MKKLLLAGSSLVALALFVLGGMEVPNQNAAVATNPAEVVSTRTLGSSAKNSEQIPDTTPLETGEVLGVQSIEPTQLASQVAVKASGTKNSSDVFNNVVDSSDDSHEVAYSTPASLSSNSTTLRSAEVADLSASTPTRVPSFGPNGTHWPSLVPTPYIHDDSQFAHTITVGPDWEEVKAAINSVTTAQANAGTRILITPGEMRGFGNSTGATSVLEGVGSESWTKRVVVAPRDGFGSVEWTGGTKIYKVRGLAFAEFIADGINFGGNTRSALVRILNSDYLSINGIPESHRTNTVEIIEYVQPNHYVNNGDAAQVQASSGGGFENYLIEGSYFAPRFFEKNYTGSKPHTDTFQFAGSKGYGDVVFRDSAVFSSNNTAIQNGNIDGLHFENTLLVSGETSLSRYPHLPSGATEATTNMLNGSGSNMSAKDSIFIGGMAVNTADAARPWTSVTNTKTSKTYGGYNQPLSGSWTVDTSLENWRASDLQKISPFPTRTYLDSIWIQDQAPRTSAPAFSPDTETHNGSVSVSLTSTTPDASIYYTTNGATPTTSSTRYTGPFTLSSTATVKAIATSAGVDPSYVQSKTYTIIQPGVPTITTQPAATSGSIGGTATFNVEATGNPIISGYQWKKNGTNISGATSASYTTPALSAGDDGAVYTVVVTNSAGSVTSNPATLTVAELTSNTSFQHAAIASQSGPFTINFNVTPLQASMDAVTGLSPSTTVDGFEDLYAIVRMRGGVFDAYNDTVYAAGRVINYVPGTTYQIQMDVNPSAKTYTVKVNGVVLAQDFMFRNKTVTPITRLTYRALDGTHTLGGITVGGGGENNSAPVVNVGVDKSITLPTNSVSLDATVTDDGRPTSNVATTWTRVSGPATVTFGNDSSVDTTATFSAAGTYVLRLTANDGDLSTFDELTVVVNAPAGTNQAPVVSAGADQTITLPTNSVSLDATVTDDGLPSGSTVTSTWSKISGSGTVSFANANSVDTTATFSAAGTYVLRLTATDGSLSASNDITIIVNPSGGTGAVTVSGELKKWHKVTLSMTGPTTSESATPNPFKDYKADVTFTHTSGRSYTVPAYFAADGNAGETSATSGNVWKAHFAPDLTGTWLYSVSFRTGSNIAISTSASAGTSASYFDGSTGSFSIANSDKSGRDLRGKGRLVYDGEHYLKFSETGERFIKAGADSPENLFAYEDFDNTPDVGKGVVKTYSSHAGDYVSGDASWKGGKGTELVGAINYLSNQGLNSISFLTFNPNEGDDGNVYPYTSDSEEERFDTSKLDQWGMVLDHATKKGMYLHFKLMEAETDGYLTNDQFKLYARELVARYGHNLALNWNLGEENGRSVTDLKLWATYLKDVDAYDHNRVLHLICGDFSTCNPKYFNLMGNGSDLTGFSMQGTSASDFSNTFAHVKAYVDESADSGKKWVIGMDEPGDASTGVKVDGSGNNHDIARKHALWGTIMAGGQGVEWYFGSADDIGTQNFRLRNNFYTYSKYAVDFLESNGLPVAGLTNQNSLISGGSNTGNKVLAQTNQVYLVQLINGGNATLDLSSASGTFNVKWLNPRTGAVTTGANVSGGGSVQLSSPDSNDWIVLVKKGGGPVTNQAPVVSAGADQSVTLSAGVTLAGSATDDGLPAGSLISYTWTETSGPGNVNFANASSANTSATFSAAGTYVLQLSASDGALTGTDTVTVTVSGTTPTGVFNSAGGVVVIETENTTSSLGSGGEFWALRAPGNAAYVADATNNAHLEYRSNDVDALFIDDTPGDVPLEYTFKINDGGYYQLHIRSHKNIENVDRPDLNNDAFIKVNGVGGSTFTAGPNAGSAHLKDAPLSMLQSYTKIAGGSATTWAWADQLDAGGDNNKRYPVYGFQTGGTYTLTMSGRSRGFAPDRFVFRKVDTIPMPLAKNYAIPESSKIDGGTNPGITPITFGSTQVRTVELVNVRPGPSLSSGLVGQMPFGSVGTIVGGPTVSSDNITWWQVNFAGATDGWTGQDNLEVIPGTGSGTNQAPVVSAGTDVSIALPASTATLVGSATDSDGTIASRVWTKVVGPAATLSGETTNTLSLSGLVAGTYTFRLTATDDDGASAFDDVTVTVTSVFSGTAVYIRSGATGDGSSWSNALGSVPASANLVRGTTYYIADGSYGSYSFTKAKSGTTMINFKKATAADHGTDTGWVSSYGDGTANFDYFEIRNTGYFALDGGTRTGDRFEQKGIVVKTQVREKPFYIVGSDNVRVSNVEMDANFAQTKTCQVVPINSSSNVVFTRNYMHDAGDDGSEIWDVTGLVFEDNEIAYLHGYSNEDLGLSSLGCANGHSDGLELKTVRDAVFNRNYFHDIPKTSSFFTNNWLATDETNITISNNIFHTPEASATAYFHNMSNAQIFHNTFLQGRFAGVVVEADNSKNTHDVTNFDMNNNIISSMSIKDQFVGTSLTTRDSQMDIDYNLIVNQDRHGLATYVPNTNDIYLNWKENKPFAADLFEGADLNELYYSGRLHPNNTPDAEDFTPAATNPGINRGKTGLPASVTIAGVVVDIASDFFGQSRIGTPDMGAIEFRGSAPSGNPLLVGVWGSGTVTGNGISCGDDCRELFSSSQSVTLTATPATGATFRGWSGACTGTTATCSVTVSKATSVTAKFEGVAAPEDYAPGTRVQLIQEDTRVRNLLATGRPSTGGTLVKQFMLDELFSSNGTMNSITGTILEGSLEGSDLLWYKIQFDAPFASVVGWSGIEPYDIVGATSNYNLSVSKTGLGSVTSSPSGIDCGTDCSNSYVSGTTVTLTAIPASGATFTGWSGACTGTGTCTVTMNSAKSVTATFSSGGDDTAPSVPAGLTNAGVTATTAALSWSASTDDTWVTGYEILQNGTVVGNSAATSYTATGLTMNTVYSFAVRAFDAAGNKSANSTSLSVTTSNIVDNQAPSVPVGLAQAGVSNTSATITWSPSTDDNAVTSYEIFRGATPVGTSNVTSFTDSGLTRDTAYSYTVRAKDAAGNTSAASVALSIRTTDTTSNTPVRVPSFGPNGTHWPSQIPTPFMYDTTIPNQIIVEPTWAAVKTALQGITKAQADAGTIILVKPGTMIGSGWKGQYSSVLKDLGSKDWTKRVTVAPRDGYGTVLWGGPGTTIENVYGVAFAGFVQDFERNSDGSVKQVAHSSGGTEPGGGLRFLGNTNSALAWINIKTNVTLIYGAETGTTTKNVELVEVVSADSRASHDDAIVVNGNDSGVNGIYFDGSYFSPRFFRNADAHTDTLQFSGTKGPYKNAVIRDSAFFGSNNGAIQTGNLEGLELEHSYIASGPSSRSRYPWISGLPSNGVSTEFALNGSGSKFSSKDDTILGQLKLNSTNSSRKWSTVTNSKINNLTSMSGGAYRTYNQTGGINDPLSGAWVDVSDMDQTNSNMPPYPTDTYLAQIWAKDSTPVTYRTLTTSVTGSGSVSGTSVPTQQYVDGTSVTLTATPTAGATFTGWGGACAGTSTTCTILMNANKTVSASFSIVATPTHVLTLSKSGTGTGTITSNPAVTNGVSQAFDQGTAVVLTATPSAGSTFAGWSGACAGTSASCTVTMSAAQNVTATFNLATVTQYTLTVTKSGTGSGTVSGSAASQAYDSGTTVTLTATPDANSTFTGWSNACSGSSATCSVTMSSNKTAVATFATIPAGQVSTPTFSPTSTTTSVPVNVTISSATAGAAIRYTTNGSTPTTSSTLYSGPITVSSNATIKAIASKSGMTNSSVGEATYTFVTVGGNGPYTSTGSHQNKSFAQLSGVASRTGNFTVNFNMTPNNNDMDAITGLTYNAADGFSDYAAVVRFNAGSGQQDPYIDAYNGTAYDVDNQVIEYTQGTTYAVRMEVDVPNKRYSVWVNNQQIAQNYAFRTASAIPTPPQLNNFALVAVSGSHGVSNVVIGTDAGGDDTQAPSVPAGLSSSNVTSSSVTLGWNASTDTVGVTGYDVLRGTTAGNLAVIGSVARVGFTDSGLSADTTYYYALRAKDAAGNTSDASTVFSVRTNSVQDTEDPSAPEIIQIYRETASSLTIDWTQSSDDTGVYDYQVYRNGVLIASNWYTSFEDNGLSAGTSYTYRISARDAAGNESQLSAPVTARTLNDEDTVRPTVTAFTIPGTSSTLNIPILSLAATDNQGSVQYVITETSTTPAVSGTGTNWTSNIPSSHLITSGSTSGTYTLYAWAKDPSDNISLSRSASVIVTLPDITLPEVQITSPAANALISGSAVAITANATDNIGVVSVQFKIDNTVIATDTTAPYATTFNASTLSAGAHTISAIARDAAGRERTATISVIVGTTAPTDSDLDGVPDLTDRCSNTPANVRDFVNQYGCPKPKANNFDILTDFQNVDLTAVTNLVIGKSNVGRIQYPTQTINLTQGVGSNSRLDLDTLITIDQSKVTVNSSAAPQLNKPATITLYNITTPNPIIMKDGVACTNCTIVSFSNGTLVFTVQGFSTYEIVGDTTAPTRPSNLSSSSVTTSSVKISWSASTDSVGVTGYEVFRGTTLLGTTGSLSYTDTGLDDDTAYSYTVKAYDAAGNKSSASNALSVTTDKDSSVSGSTGGSTGGGGGAGIKLSCDISDTTIAPGSTISIGAVASKGRAPYEYRWSKDASKLSGFNLTTQNQRVTFNTKGTYTLAVKVTDDKDKTKSVTCSKITVDAKYNLATSNGSSSGSIGSGSTGGSSTGSTGSGSTGSTGSGSTGGSSYAFYRDLAIGATGEDVRQLQKFLNARGYTVAVSGAGSNGLESTYFGPATTAALARWQAANAVSPAAGYFGPLTRGRVNGGASVSVPVVTTPVVTKPIVTTPVVTTPVVTNPSAGTSSVYLGKNLAPGVTDADVIVLQKFLNKYGFTIASSGAGAPGNEGTYYGELTKQAVKRFQASKGIPSDGWTYERTRAAINAMGASI